MKIKKVICAPGKTGFFFDDQKAIKLGAKNDGAFYTGSPVTEGFSSVRQAGESISVIFLLEDGSIAHGDCAAVQYSGAGGRDPLFLAENFIPIIEKEIAPLYEGREITNFREMANIVDKHVSPSTGKIYHTAIRYGVTQACLDAVAKSQHKLMAQVVADEYGTTVSDKLIPIFSQSGDDRYQNADKMIMKGAEVLPHALFNHVEEKVGLKGEKIVAYLEWLRNRILNNKPFESYNPTIHIDVYGTLGLVFDNNFENIANYIGELEKVAAPFKLRVEGPVDMGEKQAQIEALAEIRRLMESKGIKAEIVADEWCNTLEDIIDFTEAKAGHMAQIKTPDLGGINNAIEAVIYCKNHQMGAYLGGTCNETNRSAEICAHIAMATQPVQYLAKPGMGVDEGYMIVFNEMSRVLALKNVL
ncbi:methylaspartate ammonia-lyase [Porphyromonas crevioricanis]|uniref:methylaspartate ammonia-lyase n=2 Tax=Porphyromonas crevioricanis TaxID=393921 RepID=A0A0A2FQ19_9PORP|nr:methylaspartate ammonia-lyase [Porphyromonas crevioricanis]KGN88681.1 methylaspartate ammonia-lyase [Porphyromonas crevioricanis]KGN93211.1 methylaspartate ammonia-lyase [Porphyromonas crevioricanis]SJZ97452.1 methylaspartate ammonia-lyase [Porphyromonas crevioricanis]SQH73714.1 Methylaspartate ammonia-lyase [Porphyromonas crevioricanis]GAD05067.1 methylaspartate ammonia-lyase [Porphyromonas crevioricanis JCM 15906]